MAPKAAATKGTPKLAHWDVEETWEQYSTVSEVFRSQCGQSGKLTFEEVLQVFQKLDSRFTEERLRKMWAALDRDQSGDIDWLELLSFVFDLDKLMEASFEDYKGLIRTAVYCRIRPFGKDGHDIGQEVEKKLDGWTENSVFVKDRHQRVEYKFPKQVLPPEASQEETFRVVMHDVVDAWLVNATNVLLFAYGQTGTGKTHTMFGTKECLLSDEPHPDWGLFPRAAHKCIKTTEMFTKAYEGTGAPMGVTLRASAIEFYMGEANDLLNDRKPLMFLPDGSPVGAADVQINKVSDLAPFLDTVAKNRTMSGTKMNSGSSRSHCALILTLAECGNDPGKEDLFYLKRSLTLMDMAGSERPDKAGTERMSGNAIVELLYSGRKPTKAEQQGMEGAMINFELSAIKSEIAKATDENQKKTKYKNNAFPETPLTRYIGRCLVGQAWLTSIVCLSQSPQNGWETWFSCEYGKGLAMLQAPLRKVKVGDAGKLEKELTAAVAKAKKVFESTPEKGSASSKYYELRMATFHSLSEELALVQELIAQARAATGTAAA